MVLKLFQGAGTAVVAADAATFALGVLADPTPPFKAHRTGDLARLPARVTPWRQPLIRKRYWYPTPRDRRRGWLRTTFGAPSRVAREAAALARLAALGLQPPLAVAWGEVRRRGVLVDSFLLLAEVAGPSLDAALAEGSPPARTELAARLGAWVARLHAAALEDRDLHLRNFVVAPDGALAKVDSPFLRTAPPWSRRTRLARERAALAAEVAASAGEAAAAAFSAAAAARACRG